MGMIHNMNEKKTDQPNPSGLVVAPIPQGPVDGKLECPFCNKQIEDARSSDGVTYHKCEADSGEKVAMLNGHAIKGLSAYHKANVPRGASQ
jgi:hypothetical protein